jgi:hypothetical protein
VEELIFETEDTPIEIPVTVGKAKYFLCEAMGDVAAKYENRKVSNMKLDNGKPVSVMNTGDLAPFLLSLCMFYPSEDGTKADRTKPVNPVTIRGFKSKTMRTLFDKARKISDIDQPTTIDDLKKQIKELTSQLKDLETEGTPAKNEQGETTDGSE